MLGNSLTNNSQPASLPDVFQTGGWPSYIGAQVRGSTSLTQFQATPYKVGDTLYGPDPYTPALSSFPFSGLSLEPYTTSATLGSEAASFVYIANLARNGAPGANIKLYLYEGWPSLNSFAPSNPYTSYWDAAITNADSTPMTLQQAAMLAVLSRARAALGSNVYVIPAGAVLRAIDVAARASSIPGATKVDDFYADNSHMGGAGRFAVACTVFSTIAKARLPDSAVWQEYVAADGTVPLTASLASILAQIAWNTVSSDPNSGV